MVGQTTAVLRPNMIGGSLPSMSRAQDQTEADSRSHNVGFTVERTSLGQL